MDFVNKNSSTFVPIKVSVGSLLQKVKMFHGLIDNYSFLLGLVHFFIPDIWG